MDTEKLRYMILDYIHLLTSKNNSYDYHTDEKLADARLMLNSIEEGGYNG